MRRAGESSGLSNSMTGGHIKRQDSHPKASLILLKAEVGSAENLVARKDRVLPVAKRASNLFPG